ncbi:MAG: Hsp20/alpha crystallin family protein, partial [Thermoleophilia bacterium]|nr:Hsp20/alpha crystallin family protein [Thermoleophilia bacterium]
MSSLVRFDPFRDIGAVRDEMDRVFGRAFGERLARTWTPALDVLETTNEIILKAEVPGLKAEDIEVEFDDNVLTISGERAFEETSEDGSYHRVERAYGTFSRSVTLPRGIKANDVSADVTDGVL